MLEEGGAGDSGAIACPLWGGLGSGVPGYRTLGVPDLAPAHWCVELGPGPSGGQGHVQEMTMCSGSLKAAYLMSWWGASLPS